MAVPLTPELEALLSRGRRCGPYLLETRIGEGGMGAVYRARRDPPEVPPRNYAIKLIHGHLARNPRYAGLFEREAQLAGRVDHPNVCRVIESGDASGTPFIAMEYLDGATLSELLSVRRDHAVPDAIAARILIDAARGLHAAHELRTPDGAPAQLVHRDVSPSNLFVLFDGTTKVVDFGIARSIDTEDLTVTGELRGKLSYLSPEQAQRAPLDRRSDVFALGIVLWEITVGQRLFRRDAELDTLLAVTREPIPLPSHVRVGYPPLLERIVRTSLERDRDARYPTAAAFADELERLLQSNAIGSPAREDVARFVRDAFPTRSGNAAQSEPSGQPFDGPTFTETRDTYAAATIDGTATVADAAPTRVPDFSPSVDARPIRTSPRVANVPVVGALALVAVAALSGLGVFALRRGTTPPPSASSWEFAPHAAAPATQVAMVPSVTASPPPPTQPESAGTPSEPPPSDTTAAAITRPPTSRAAHAPSTHRSAAHDGHAEVAGTGFVNVIAIPAARVYEASALLGTTPLVRQSLPTGRHALRIVRLDGRGTLTRVVQIEDGQTVPLSVRWP